VSPLDPLRHVRPTSTDWCFYRQPPFARRNAGNSRLTRHRYGKNMAAFSFSSVPIREPKGQRLGDRGDGRVQQGLQIAAGVSARWPSIATAACRRSRALSAAAACRATVTSRPEQRRPEMRPSRSRRMPLCQAMMRYWRRARVAQTRSVCSRAPDTRRSRQALQPLRRRPSRRRSTCRPIKDWRSRANRPRNRHAMPISC
jgi:hypothetical protein